MKGDRLFYLLPYGLIQIHVIPFRNDIDCMKMLVCCEDKKWIDIYVQFTQSMGQSQVEQSIVTQNPSVTIREQHGIEGLIDNDVDNESKDGDNKQEEDDNEQESNNEEK